MSPSAFDQPMKDLAGVMADVFGKDIEILPGIQDADYDPASGMSRNFGTPYVARVTPPTSFSSGAQGGASQRYDADDVVRHGDLSVSVPRKGAPRAPEVGDAVRFDDMTFQVISVHPVYSGSQIAMWRLQLRK